MWLLLSFVLSDIQGHLLLSNNFIVCQSNFTVSLKTVSLKNYFCIFIVKRMAQLTIIPKIGFWGFLNIICLYIKEKNVLATALFLMLRGDEALQKCTIKRIQYNQRIRCHFPETATKVGQC